ncbi:hypothetical protein BDP81DRAFT_393453 [Colletotrichum phormii]|uniref:Uncharacterized protein n=1 Tax=Colletotrichum phormii TaxID=359342 RepID=A0AAJ0EI64_9PEZI|nr:uncharacterized protein BDP81DRAFT_393453 [Colletotrichum phormii]KAK1637766.1 hypothetical protein BDP81DRAFT_393453 [Colletotrichum phormii]
MDTAANLHMLKPQAAKRWCSSSEADFVDSTPPIPAKAPRSGRAPSIRLRSLLASEQYQSLLDRRILPLQVLLPAVFISVLAPAFLCGYPPETYLQWHLRLRALSHSGKSRF